MWYDLMFPCTSVKWKLIVIPWGTRSINVRVSVVSGDLIHIECVWWNKNNKMNLFTKAMLHTLGK